MFPGNRIGTAEFGELVGSDLDSKQLQDGAGKRRAGNHYSVSMNDCTGKDLSPPRDIAG